MYATTRLVLIRAASLTSDSTMASGELDLGPYVESGKREIGGVWGYVPNSASTDTDGTYDNKFQESATTVDSDFSDITGAAFTQVAASDTAALQQIAFSTNKRYIRSLITLGGTVAKVIDFTAVRLTTRMST